MATIINPGLINRILNNQPTNLVKFQISYYRGIIWKRASTVNEHGRNSDSLVQLISNYDSFRQFSKG